MQNTTYPTSRLMHRALTFASSTSKEVTFWAGDEPGQLGKIATNLVRDQTGR